MPAPDSQSLTSFGYRDVAEDEKPDLVGKVFASVARRYDVMNDLMSGGIHRLWKDAMVEWLNPQPGQRVVDVAGGTGDIAFRIASLARTRGGEPEIVVCDRSEDMLTEGVRRMSGADADCIRWVRGDAQALPIPDCAVDAYTVAFGIRNFARIDVALSEAFRVLKPGGRFLCLEFARVQAPVLDALYERYSFSVLPRLGEMVANDADAYRYLAESIRRFPPQAAFAKMIERAGFARVKIRNLSGGIAAMHSAWRI